MENNDDPDGDGDYPFWGETCRGWVQPITAAPWGVWISAVAALGVPNKVAVLREVNEVNCADPMASTFLRPDGTVMAYRLTAESVTEEHARGILIHVMTVADRIGPMLAAVHAGQTPKPMRPAIVRRLGMPEYRSAFPPVYVTVDVVLLTTKDDQLQMLMIKRGSRPWRGWWALPGGFIRQDEDLTSAARRELAEETGLKVEPSHLEQIATFGRRSATRGPGR